MKKFCCLTAVLALLASCLLPPRHGSHDQNGNYRPVEFEPPMPERFELDNGMVVYLLKDHELPLIQVSCFIRTGAVYEPDGLAGLAALTGTVMRTGGTAAMRADEVDRQLENRGALLNVAIGLEQGTATLSVLREDFDPALSIFSDILINPAFEQDKIEVARRTTIQGLRQVPDNPQSLAFREFRKLLYAGNPRGAQPTIGSVKRIGRQDMLRFHQRFFRPENVMLAVSGDFKPDSMLSLIKERFGQWPSSAGKVQPVKPPGPLKRQSTFYLQKQLPQSTIIVGQFAPEKADPDVFAFYVIDFIIGSGGFTSRLFSEVRSSQGLAYSVGSFFRPDADYGVFGAYCMTKAGSTHRALNLMMKILEKIEKGEISEQEVALAKQSILNNFIFSFTSSAQIAAQQMQLEYDGLPADYLRSAPSKISALSLSDVTRVAAQRLHPDKMIVFFLGDVQQLDRELDDWQWGGVRLVTSDILSEN